MILVGAPLAGAPIMDRPRKGQPQGLPQQQKKAIKMIASVAARTGIEPVLQE